MFPKCFHDGRAIMCPHAHVVALWFRVSDRNIRYLHTDSCKTYNYFVMLSRIRAYRQLTCHTAAANCPGNTEYSSCGTSCPVSCANYHHHDSCDLECTEGCFCPPGTVAGWCLLLSMKIIGLFFWRVTHLTCKRENINLGFRRFKNQFELMNPI